MAKKKKTVESKSLPKLPVTFTGLGSKREATFPVEELAKQAGISAPALAGMKSAYEWDSNTKMTQADFNKNASSWLSAGGK